MKKLSLILLTLVLVLSLASCFGKEECTKHTDKDGNGFCDNCDVKMPDDGDDEGSKDTLDITAHEYTLIYHAYEPKQKQMAQEFAREYKEKTGNELSLKSHKEAESEYEIQFGEVSERAETKAILRILDGVTNTEVSAYSIKLDGNVLVITGTAEAAIQQAADKALSLISDGKLVLNKTYEDSAVLYKSGNNTVSCSLEDFAKKAALSSISVGGVKLSAFSENTKTYTATYPSTANYPTINASSLNPRALVTVVQAKDNGGIAKVTVQSADKSCEEVYTVNFEYAENSVIISEIVNKNAADGVVSFVFDDGLKQTADVLSTRLLPKYEDVVVSYAIVTKDLATVGKLNGGRYELTPVTYQGYSPLPGTVFENSTYKYNYEFWNAAAAFREGNELISHSHTHTDALLTNPEYELKVSQQILNDLCGERALTFINPGVENPNNYSKETYNDVRVNSGIYIGARGGGDKVITAPWLKEYENRFSTYSMALQNHSTQKDPVTGGFTTNAQSSRQDCLDAGISRWTDHIDNAVANNGWSAYCIHNVIPAGQTSSAKWHIYEEQMDALFAHAQSLSDQGKLWIANYTDAQMYYNQWASAEVSTVVFADESVTVALTIPDSEPQKALLTMEMTVKVPVPMSWTTASFTYGSKSGDTAVYENEDGTKYVYVDIAPGSTTLTLTES